MLQALVLTAALLGADPQPAPAPPVPAPAANAAGANGPEAAAVAPPVPPPKVDPQLFNRALQDFFIGDTRSASNKLYTYLQGTSTTDENHAWAQYFIARSFAELGLWHAAGYYLAQVARERSNPAVLPRALEE